MTKKELKELIKSFNRKPGEYTDEELYKIGVAHKQLPHGEIDWISLTKELGVNKSSETFRKWIVRKQDEKGELKKDATRLSGKTINDAKEEKPEILSALDAKLDKIYIEQQKVRDHNNSIRRTLRDESRIDSLKEFVAEKAKALPALPKYTYIKSNNGNTGTEAILLLSDLHIGVECENFYNKYNTSIAEARLDMLADNVVKYCNANNVKKLNICNLGDLIAGLIHINARIEQESDTVEQVMIASELLARFLAKVATIHGEVVYRSCTDNHSRMVANLKEHIEKDNLYKLIDWWLEPRLKSNNIPVKMLNDNIDAGLGKFDLMNGKKVMFAHGHNDSVNSVYQNFTGATGEFIDYILLGHYHCEKAKSFQNSRVVVNGSIVGVEQYALSKRLFSKPSQTLLIFDGDNVINYSIGLANAKEEIKPTR